MNGQVITFDTSPVNVELMSRDRKVNMKPLCETIFFMYFCIKSSIWTQGGWLAVKVLKPPVLYSTALSKAVVPVLVSLCCFAVYSTRRFVLFLTLCYFVLMLFSPFSIAITSLGEEKANLSAFRTLV